MSSDSHHLRIYQKEIFVKDFRNIAELSLSFGEGHNLFIGSNGQGKTNCLEAIAIACSLKPMQALHNSDLIRFTTASAKIIAHFGGAETLDVAIDILPHGKKAKLNGHPLKASSQLAHHCRIVSFIPAELSLISTSHSLRRRALDQAAVALFSEHAVSLRSYEKILQNRNRLLKDWPQDPSAIAIFTDLLIKEGAELMHQRQKAIEHLNPIFKDMLHEILGAGHHGDLVYHARGRPIADFAISDLRAFLNQAHQETHGRERHRKMTMFGPHLDDLVFLLNGVDGKTFASRGQTRALVFAFKLALMMAIHRLWGHAPIIILDDIVSELDSAIKSNLIETVAHLKSQVFFTTTDRETFGSRMPIDRVFVVNGGMVNECGSSR